MEMQETQEGTQRMTKKEKRREILSWILSLVTVVVLVVLMKRFLFNSVLVEGESMVPTFANHDQLFTQQDFLTGGNYRRGDVVVFNPPIEYGKKGDFIKRIVGLPGEIIKVSGGKVYINDEVFEEDYLPEGLETGGDGVWVLTDDYVFVMGDNRGGSMDSRIFGPITIDSIRGVVVFRYWPLSSLGVFSRGEK